MNQLLATTADPMAKRKKARKVAMISVSAAALGAMIGSTGMGPYSGNPVLGAAIGAGALFLLATVFVTLADWRHGLVLLLAIVLGEDSIRKAIPNAPNWVNLGKDFVVAAAYLSFLFRGRAKNPYRLPREARMLVIAPLMVWAAFVIFEAFNPGVQHVLIGISGIRTWLLYMPLFVLAAYFVQDLEKPERMFNLLVMLAIPFLALTLLQNTFGESLPSFLHDKELTKYRTLESGESIRYNESVFATSTAYSLVCVFHLCLVVGLLKIKQTPRMVVMIWIAGYCAVAGAYLSGIRTGLSFIGIAIIALSPLMLLRKRRRPDGSYEKRHGLLIGAVVGILVGACLVVSMKETRAKAFWSGLDPSVVNTRMAYAVEVTQWFDTGPIGAGTGTAGKSGQVLALVGEEGSSNTEVEWGTALIKFCFGDVGMVLGAIVLVWLMLGLLKLAIEHRHGRYMPLRYALWVYVCAQLSWFLFKAYPVLENGTMTLMCWTSVGFILGLHEIDRREFAGVSNALLDR
ncbi:MAG: hypothetical protein IT462_01180 [Planctomycetes bacterium]|nr:hypothetical protein [Planctomycetota bacterium]